MVSRPGFRREIYHFFVSFELQRGRKAANPAILAEISVGERRSKVKRIRRTLKVMKQLE